VVEMKIHLIAMVLILFAGIAQGNGGPGGVSLPDLSYSSQIGPNDAEILTFARGIIAGSFYSSAIPVIDANRLIFGLDATDYMIQNPPYAMSVAESMTTDAYEVAMRYPGRFSTVMGLVMNPSKPGEVLAGGMINY